MKLKVKLAVFLIKELDKKEVPESIRIAGALLDIRRELMVSLAHRPLYQLKNSY
jgi:hypothetical protein